MYVIIKSKKPKGKALKKHILKDIVPCGLDARIVEIQGKHQQAITDHYNQIHTLEFTNEKHQQKILRLNKEIDGLIKNRHVPRLGYLDNVLCFIKKNSMETNHITLFDVNIDSLKNFKNVLNFVTQTWKRPRDVMIQMLFIDGTYSIVK